MENTVTMNITRIELSNYSWCEIDFCAQDLVNVVYIPVWGRIVNTVWRSRLPGIM